MLTTMKNLRKIGLFAVAAFVLALPACQPEEEEPTPTDDRDKFVAAWTCVENSTNSGQTTFNVHINKSTTNSAQVKLENLYNIGQAFSAVADVSGSNLTIPQQVYNNKPLHGSGTMVSNNTINMTYYVDLGSGNIDTCTATLTRQ
ncbi:MAG: hypothetical protein FD123_2702 [Bacteroidetes bacterium]|nr:MAG: hypothetical protein FD123_2702 [Bacteroidota bacterium]